MATESTPEQNDLKVDNRDEYTPPPVTIPIDQAVTFDSDGFAEEAEEAFDITYNEDGSEVFGASIVEEEVE